MPTNGGATRACDASAGFWARRPPIPPLGLQRRNGPRLHFRHARRDDGRRRALRAPEGRGPGRRAASGGRVTGAGTALRARPGRAALGGLGGAADHRQGGAAEADLAAAPTLVRRACPRRSALVQRRGVEAVRRPRRAALAARAPWVAVRIAVCRPQVPFVYGVAEVAADEL